MDGNKVSKLKTCSPVCSHLFSNCIFLQWLDSFISPCNETTLNCLDTHFSRVSQSHRMVGATSHFCDLPIEQVSRHEHGSHSLVGCPISQLAVTVMAPGKQLSIWVKYRPFCSSWSNLIQMWRKRLDVWCCYLLWPAGCGDRCRSSGWPLSSRSKCPPFWGQWCSGCPLCPDSYYSWVQTRTPERGERRDRGGRAHTGDQR